MNYINRMSGYFPPSPRDIAQPRGLTYLDGIKRGIEVGEELERDRHSGQWVSCLVALVLGIEVGMLVTLLLRG